MYIARTMLLLPLGAFIEIATGRMSFIITGTALILALGLCNETASGVWVYISRDYINTATERSVCISIILGI